jgi:HAD superfamily hydrolase (TIGR01450 family)
VSGLLDGYDAVLLDLDGTVVRGRDAVPGAADVVAALREADVAVQFITNNASRSPDEVAEHLGTLGIEAGPDDVLTSGQAAVGLLSAELSAGSAVLVVGSAALVAAVEEAGLRPVSTAAEQPVAVVQGHSPQTGWALLAEACIAIRGGARWIASNVDRTLPTERGLLPGNGAMVAALVAATDRTPTVAGKPERPLLDAAVHRVGARCPLMVGDRIDTDIAGARAAGLDSLAVLSGVADAAALLSAPAAQRPTFLGADVQVLRGELADARIAARPGWDAAVSDGTVTLKGPASLNDTMSPNGTGTPGDPLDALRTLCAAWWAEGEGPVQLRAADDDAAKALDAVGLGALLE